MESNSVIKLHLTGSKMQNRDNMRDILISSFSSQFEGSILSQYSHNLPHNQDQSAKEDR